VKISAHLKGVCRVCGCSDKRPCRIASPRYTVTFACYEPHEEFGALKSKAIVGEAELLRFLQLINVDADDLKAGSRVLEERGYVEFANVVLSDERLVNFDLR
jgi:hypothetical protein